MFKNGMRPIHPGEILREEYMEPLGLSANALAKALHVTAARMNEIAKEQRAVTPETAIRLATFFGGNPQFWLNLQVTYDLKVAEKSLLKSIQKEVAPYVAAAEDERFALAT